MRRRSKVLSLSRLTRRLFVAGQRWLIRGRCAKLKVNSWATPRRKERSFIPGERLIIGSLLLSALRLLCEREWIDDELGYGDAVLRYGAPALPIPICFRTIMRHLNRLRAYPNRKAPGRLIGAHRSRKRRPSCFPVLANTLSNATGQFSKVTGQP
jgi:hypothetical protein